MFWPGLFKSPVQKQYERAYVTPYIDGFGTNSSATDACRWPLACCSDAASKGVSAPRTLDVSMLRKMCNMLPCMAHHNVQANNFADWHVSN